MVIFDGEKICVQVKKSNYKKLLEIAELDENYEYISNENIFCFSPTKKIARMIYEVDKSFDESANIFIQDNSVVKKSLTTEIKDDNFEKLYPFQKETVQTFLSNNKNYLLSDEQGLGKTVQGSMYLKLNPDSLPTIIVCPATLKVNWSDEVEKWAGLRTYIIQGKNPEYLSEEFVKKYPVWIINYDILGFEDKKEREIENERKKYCKENGLYYKAKNLEVYGWVDEINRHNFKTIICDEVQYISEPDTLRSRGVQKICKGNSRKIFMSGTPYETRTSQFFTALNILNKKMFPSRWQYLMRYCNPKKTFFGWQFNGLSNGEELHQKISTLMIRRLKKDVLTQLPPKQRIVVPMEVPDTEYKKYKKAEQELDDAIANGEKNALTKLSELKQVCVNCKFNSCISWIDDYIESGNKLVVFVYHTVVFETLMTKYKKIAVGINGSTPNNERQNNVKKFQNDEKIKLFIGNISACCTGLTLTRANAVCFIEFGRSYPQMVQAEDRIHRISQTADSVFAYYLIMKNGIDEIIMETINERSKGINKVMDNLDNSMFNETDDLSKDILKKFKERSIK